MASNKLNLVSTSLAGKGDAAEAPVIKKHLLAALIEHTSNLLLVLLLAGYIFLMFASLKYLELWMALVAIAFMSPYFIMMLRATPMLKGFYIEHYAMGTPDANVAGKASTGKM